MILYFKDSHGKMRQIAEIDDCKSHKEIVQSIIEHIKNFYYTRIWDEECDGKQMTKFDVGSYTEFFYTDPPTYNYFMEEKKNE